MKTFFIIAFMALFVGQFSAQDLIYKRNKEVIQCEVANVTKVQIEYTQEEFNPGVVFTIDKSKVEKIVYASGEVRTFPVVKEESEEEAAVIVVSHEESEPKPITKEINNSGPDYNLQKKNIIKFAFFSPLAGALSFGYEHSLGLKRSVEFSAGLIGLGSNIYENARGGYFRMGYKLIRDPDTYERLGSGGHILKGFYVRPDIMFSYFTYSDFSYGSSGSYNIQTDAYSFAFLVSFGKQWVFSDSFSFNWFVGLGYAFSTQEGYYYSHATGGNDFPIAGSLGLSVGLLH